MPTKRKAEVAWHGSLLEGSGQIGETTSGAFDGLGVTWKARSEDDHGGLTSPEELVAAAHAACFSMALSSGLAKAGTPAEEIRTSAEVTFQPGEGITHIALTVSGKVPGVEAHAFEQMAETAKQNCPVSKALAGVPEIALFAVLVS